MKKKDLKKLFLPEYKENYTKFFMFILGILLIVTFLCYPVVMIYKNGLLAEKNGNSRWFVSNNEVFFDSLKVYTFIPVTGGKLLIGENWQMSYSDKDSISTTESNLKQVQIGSFLLGETEVTQLFWDCVMIPNYRVKKQLYYNNRPIRSKTYDEWMKFIHRLDSLTGRNFRIPTLNEWDFAARGGIYSKGYKYAGSNEIDEVAYYAGNTLKNFVIHGRYQVKKKKPNELGLYDLSGGASEFTSTRVEESPLYELVYSHPSFKIERENGRLARVSHYFSSQEQCSLRHDAFIAVQAGARLVMEH